MKAENVSATLGLLLLDLLAHLLHTSVGIIAEWP